MNAPLASCAAPGCGELIPSGSGGRCAEHARAADEQRGNASDRGYDSTWNRFVQSLFGGVFWSKYKGRCADCRRRFVERREVQWDHITALKHGGARLSEANVQPLCRACHQRKTARGE